MRKVRKKFEENFFEQILQKVRQKILSHQNKKKIGKKKKKKIRCAHCRWRPRLALRRRRSPAGCRATLLGDRRRA
jgi:hypothetical protein